MSLREQFPFLVLSFKGEGYAFCIICHVDITINHVGPTVSIIIERLEIKKMDLLMKSD